MGNQGFTLWFTGLSGAGKSELAHRIQRCLALEGRRTELLDGDEFRKAASADLGFSSDDRDINVRRIGYTARLLSRNGVAVMVACISPNRLVRNEVRASHDSPFIEIYVECAIEELVRRDTKGLYAKAMKNEITEFTGVSSRYEPPLAPDIHIRTDADDCSGCVSRVLEWLAQHRLITCGECEGRDGERSRT